MEKTDKKPLAKVPSGLTLRSPTVHLPKIPQHDVQFIPSVPSRPSVEVRKASAPLVSAPKIGSVLPGKTPNPTLSTVRLPDRSPTPPVRSLTPSTIPTVKIPQVRTEVPGPKVPTLSPVSGRVGPIPPPKNLFVMSRPESLPKTSLTTSVSPRMSFPTLRVEGPSIRLPSPKMTKSPTTPLDLERGFSSSVSRNGMDEVRGVLGQINQGIQGLLGQGKRDQTRDTRDLQPRQIGEWKASWRREDGE